MSIEAYAAVRQPHFSSNLPKSLQEAALEAWQAYPELHRTLVRIHFRQVKKATMQARPRWDVLLRGGKKRSYEIRIRTRWHFSPGTPLEDFPHEVLVGWFAHEMGHIMDYRRRNSFSMLRFVVGYLFSSAYRRQAEHTADCFAIEHGLGPAILATKTYLLEQAGLPFRYRRRLEQHYLSPEATVELIEAWEGPLMPEG
jgi:hypothetical protein